MTAGIRLILIALAALLFFNVAASSPAMAQDRTDSIANTRLPILVHELEGDMSKEHAAILRKILLETLYRYETLTIYTEKEFSSQLGWARKEKQIDCQFTEDCQTALRAMLGIKHDITLALRSRADGKLNLRMTLFEGEEGREFVETIPEFGAAPLMLEKMIPDLIGLAPTVGPERGVVRVSSFPLGADVAIDDISLCKTPCSFGLDNGKRVAIRAQRPGHPPVYTSIKGRMGHVTQWYADLIARQGEILVDSEPAGATILLDGERHGETPLVLHNILEGKHDLTLRMPPYPDAEYEVDVIPNQVTRIRHGFIPENGSLQISCANQEKGKNVDIFINGIKVAENTYLAEKPTGRYRVQLVQDGYAPFEEEVTVEPGKNVVLNPTLEKGLALRPGQLVDVEKDYKPGGFATALGVVALSFGIFLETEAQKHYDNADDRFGPSGSTPDEESYNGERDTALYSRIGGGILMGLGSAAIITGIVFLVLPPEHEIAITPTVDPDKKQAMLQLNMTF